ncbi:SPX-domain-containing protein [Auriculariales sp. MPI-PUGE-AT-0066]|nr:SPX-domain-containing protein [Auriculariales sp. MPI-PUGE-AT-0066]
MKFGQKLQNDRYSAWRASLKKLLKTRTSAHEWTEEDESQFKQMLSEELEKVYKFQKDKTSELMARIHTAEAAVHRLVSRHEPGHVRDITQDEEQENVAAHVDEEEHANDVDSETDDDEKFAELEEEVAVLVADVHDLALHSKLNFTGFVKIVKKHDKQTKLSLKTDFLPGFLDSRPFYKYNWDGIIVKLSRLYDLVRTRGHPVEGDSSAGGAQSAFVRQTTKYWVHEENLVHLKLAILRHLPVLVFNSDKEYEPKDSAITSIYMDNEDLDLYLGRLEKTEGAEAVRLRWYGDVENRQIFVERKTHREDWTGERSVKARFPIKSENVDAYLRGEYDMERDFKQMLAKGKKTQAEVDSMRQLAKEVQESIQERKLQPVLRTFYNRTAFQLPGDARVRISLDTELTMIREDNWDGKTRAGTHWRREDIGIDHPFRQVDPEDIVKFQYGVLEVKLQTQFGQEPPEWVRQLVSSHLVESVPKFSKFIHGCATLYPNRVDLVPFWLPQMDVDIRKPDSGVLHIARPSGSRELVSPDDHAYEEPLSEGEDDDPMMMVAPPREEGKLMRVSAAELAEASSFRERYLLEAAVEKQQRTQADAHGSADASSSAMAASQASASRPRNLSIDPLATARAFDLSFKRHMARRPSVVLEDDAEVDSSETPARPQDAAEQQLERQMGVLTRQQEEQVQLLRVWTAPPGKKVAVPVRIEPKVYFASERTFLQWLQFSVLIAFIPTTLLNFANGATSPATDLSTPLGLLCSGAFTFGALLALMYSAGIFVHRAFKLRARAADALYYDPYGPTVLCVVLAAAIAINFGVILFA